MITASVATMFGVFAVRITTRDVCGFHTGLPGLMCKMGTDEANRVVEVVGPRGLRSLLRNTFKATYTGLHYQYIVHELWSVY